MQNYFMKEALIEAKKALELDEVPVGAVIVKEGEIIARAHNLRESLNDPTAHAEMIVIKKASEFLKAWRLNDCELYVTLEPCPMCAGAITQSRIKRVYIGAFDPTLGACGSVINILQNSYLNTMVDVQWLYDEKCSNLLQEFFKNKRRNYKNK